MSEGLGRDAESRVGGARRHKLPDGSPYVLRMEKDGSCRPVIDYRKLNDITIKDSYPLPRIDEMMDWIRGSQVFTKLDLKSGYNQIQIGRAHV